MGEKTKIESGITLAEARKMAARGNYWLAEAVAYIDACRQHGRDSDSVLDLYNELTSGQCEFVEKWLQEVGA